MENILNPFNDLTITEKWQFIGKLVIAAQHGYFSECSDVVNLAEAEGLFEKIKPISENLPEIKDLDNPIN